MQTQQAAVDGARFVQPTSQRRCAHLVHLARGDVGSDRNHAVPAHEQEGQGGQVVARVEGKTFGHALAQFAGAANVAGGVLDAGDVGNFGKTHDGVVAHVCHRAPGHVVENQRQFDGFGNGAEVAVQAFLCRLVVIGHDRKMRLRAGFPRKAGKFDGFLRGIAAGAGDDGQTPGDVVDGKANQLAVFFHGHGGRFTRGADDDDGVRAFGNVQVKELGEGLAVQRAVCKHGRDDRDDGTCNHDGRQGSE